MDLWIKEAMSRLDRKKTEILFGEHAAKDKNLSIEDVDSALATIRAGKTDSAKSTEGNLRICFKNYFDRIGQTYFVIAEYCPTFIKVVTVIKKKGKY